VKRGKKKIFLVVILLIGLNTSLDLTPLVKGGFYYVWYFETDEETYYNDGIIEINATWDMTYDPLLEEMYFQAQIYNSSLGLIWNSSRYRDLGNHDEVWLVNIRNLNLPDNYSSILFVRFFYHCYHSLYDQEDIVLEEKQIQVLKKEVSCQLIGFRDRLIFGNNLTIKARFYDGLLENSSNLINQSVIFNIKNNGELLFESNYTINSLGMINITVCSLTYLKIGQFDLIFQVENNKYYNDSFFYYNIVVENIYPHAQNPWQLITFSFASILVIASIMFILISKINKNTKQRTLSEITFRY
jgi:hypothetical protein